MPYYGAILYNKLKHRCGLVRGGGEGGIPRDLREYAVKHFPFFKQKDELRFSIPDFRPDPELNQYPIYQTSKISLKTL